MKPSCLVAAVLGLASGTQAHYTFDQLLVNGAPEGRPNDYIRKHSNGYMPTKFKNAPGGSITPLDADFTCNKGATAAPQVVQVKAGDRLGLQQAYGAGGMQHPGPSQVYMAPVADAQAAPSTGGQWYKVHQSLLCRAGAAETLKSTAWCSWNETNVWFTVPSTVPDGQYLVRGEHIGLHGAHGGEAEFYYACLQVEVAGNSATAMPGTAVSFPGAYKAGDAPVNFSVWGRSTSYEAGPGPDVIPGGTIRGSPSGATGDVSQVVGGGGGGGGTSGDDSGDDSTGNDSTDGGAGGSNTPTQPQKLPTPTPTPAGAGAGAGTPKPQKQACGRERGVSFRA